ncbi:MAG TPA: hypothetical protein EYP81_01825, partial [Thermodesulfobacteriaceae bacterium]|nr:hypothetical protein [Thermodesulfobacteriaceae bacterium]
PNTSLPYAAFELGTDTLTDSDGFLPFLFEKGVDIPAVKISYNAIESVKTFENTGETYFTEDWPFSLEFTFRDQDGNATGTLTITFDSSADKDNDGRLSLNEFIEKINETSELEAGFTNGRLYIKLKNPPANTVDFTYTVSGGDGDGKLGLDVNGDGLSDGYLAFKPQNIVSETRFASGLETLVKPTVYTGKVDSDPATLGFSGDLVVHYYNAQGKEISAETFNGANLSALVSALDGSSNLKAYIDNGEVVIALENQDIAYFVIEHRDASGLSLGRGRIFLDNAGTPYELTFNIGAIENWLYDETGKPIDTDTSNEVVDPFRIALTTDSGVIQLVQKYNLAENARYGLSAELDTQGRLLVKLSGLYDTRSFVITDTFRREASPETFPYEVSPTRFDPKAGTWFFITDEAVDGVAHFKAQNITITYRDADGNSVTTRSLALSDGNTLNDFMTALNALDVDSDGIFDFSAAVDASGRLVIRINDSDIDNDGRPDWVRFTLKSDLLDASGNLATYLARRVFYPRQGLIQTLQGLDIEFGDNRNALRISDLSDSKREALGEASLYDYYAAVVGEIGVAGKKVSDAKTFMEDLIEQLQLMRDSISAVSLDEEMANLMKYQQAFAAAAKLMTTADEMLMTLIEAKR